MLNSLFSDFISHLHPVPLARVYYLVFPTNWRHIYLIVMPAVRSTASERIAGSAGQHSVRSCIFIVTWICCLLEYRNRKRLTFKLKLTWKLVLLLSVVKSLAGYRIFPDIWKSTGQPGLFCYFELVYCNWQIYYRKQNVLGMAVNTVRCKVQSGHSL